MQNISSKKKLIVLLNLSGSYKAGAQRRYLSLFKYLQQNNQDDYFLLLNDSLYKECFKDNILTDIKNVICVPIKYGRKSSANIKVSSSQINPQISLNSIKESKLYDFLGSVSSFLKQFKAWFGYSIKLINIIKTFNIGVIYGVFTGGIWSWQIAKLLNIKFIYSYNDSAASMIERDFLRIFSSERHPLKYADKIDFLSPGILQKLKEKGLNIDEKKALFTPNSFILYDNFKPVYPKKDWVVFSARMTKLKNPDLLIHAVSILNRRGFSAFSVYFLGEGIVFPELAKLKEQLKLNNVFLEGGVSDTAKYLTQSKIFVSIQKDNNYPSQSLMEAMACENAVIASDVGETRKLVTEDEGILIPLSAEKIADAVQSLLSNPAECNRLAANARKKVLNEHSIENFSNYFFEITKSFNNKN